MASDLRGLRPYLGGLAALPGALARNPVLGYAVKTGAIPRTCNGKRHMHAMVLWDRVLALTRAHERPAQRQLLGATVAAGCTMVSTSVWAKQGRMLQRQQAW